jgi:outer membrane receptor protein involved in Fe transport
MKTAARSSSSAVTDLNPEVVYSAELEHTHRFSPTVSSTVAVFTNYVTDLIVTEGEGNEMDPIYYLNTSPLAVVGTELELRRDWRQGWMLGASYTLQHARFIASESADDLLSFRRDPDRRKVSNVPSHLGSLKGAVPIIGRALTAATRFSVEGPRYDRFEEVGEPPQGQTDGTVLWDLVLTGEENRFGMHYALGVYNLFDWRYDLPVSAEFTQRSIEQNGRTFLASVDVRF